MTCMTSSSSKNAKNTTSVAITHLSPAKASLPLTLSESGKAMSIKTPADSCWTGRYNRAITCDLPGFSVASYNIVTSVTYDTLAESCTYGSPANGGSGAGEGNTDDTGNDEDGNDDGEEDDDEDGDDDDEDDDDDDDE